MKFEVQGEVTRRVTEYYTVVVDADNEDEAKDFVYELLTDFPETDMIADRLLMTSVDRGPADIIDLRIEEDEQEPEVA